MSKILLIYIFTFLRRYDRIKASECGETMNGKKLLPVMILDILRNDTDEEHPMSTAELLSALKTRGYLCDRKTLKDNVVALCKAGFEIMCQREKSNLYYFSDREFDEPEIRILLDAVRAAVFITEKKSKELCAKISDLAGRRGGKDILRNTVAFNITKNTNEHVYYSVAMISAAIRDGKKITFKYFDYDCKHNIVYRGNGKRYEVNPLATVFSNDKYYLICYHDKYDNITHYRVDRMHEVEETDELVAIKPELTGFDLREHKKQLFGMFSGETVRAKFRADNEPFILDAVFDKFGSNTEITDKGDVFEFCADVQTSTPFFAWVSTFCGKLNIIAPDALKESFSGFVADLYRRSCGGE